MKLKLHKPICFFDLEATGLDISKDRIVEIAILKLMPNKERFSKTWRINPEISINKEATQLHGISNEDVANEPTFKDVATTIHSYIKDSDLVGYNSDRFDIPLLIEEFLRVEIEINMKNVKTIDVQTIFHKMEKRTLEAAYKFYCNKDLNNAHSASADTEATYEVLLGQLDKYENLTPTVDFLSEFSKQRKFADFSGHIIFNDKKEEVFSFGKYKGQKVVDILEKDIGYFGWIMNAEFPLYTKKVLTAIKLRKFNVK